VVAFGLHSPIVAMYESRVPMACHGPAECAEIADTGGLIVYNLRVFNTRASSNLTRSTKLLKELQKTERPKRVFGVQTESRNGRQQNRQQTPPIT
jgi:hypothetical protein